MDIQHLRDDELLADLSPSAPRPQQLLANWLIAEGYHPGATRVQAHALYDQFVRWFLQQGETAEQLPTMTSWGREMAGRFKKGRRKTGVIYFVSRESVVEIPHSLAEGGRGNRGGSPPGGGA